jgi:hypothetical protein
MTWCMWCMLLGVHEDCSGNKRRRSLDQKLLQRHSYRNKERAYCAFYGSIIRMTTRVIDLGMIEVDLGMIEVDQEALALHRLVRSIYHHIIDTDVAMQYTFEDRFVMGCIVIIR